MITPLEVTLKSLMLLEVLNKALGSRHCGDMSECDSVCAKEGKAPFTSGICGPRA